MEEREAIWRKRFKRWEESHLSKQKFCDQEGVTRSAFDYWKRKLDYANATNNNSFIRLTPQPGAGLRYSDFVLKIGPLFELQIPADYRPEKLIQLISTLRGLA